MTGNESLEKLALVVHVLVVIWEKIVGTKSLVSNMSNVLEMENKYLRHISTTCRVFYELHLLDLRANILFQW